MAAEKNPFAAIAGTVGGLTAVMIMLVVLCAPSSAWVIFPIVGFMCVFGIMLGFFASRSR